jgi:hypothetical protein
MNFAEYDNKIHGIPEGIYYGQNDRVDELNNRMLQHFQPDSNTVLQPNYNIRGTPTRNCSVFPILDIKQKARTKIIQSEYNTQENFAPMTTAGPIKGFISNIQSESQLRNQFYSLQHGADQSVYIPSSKSDLYVDSVPETNSKLQEIQPFIELFKKNTFITTENAFIKNSRNIGKDIFNNNTKIQLRNEV